MRDYYSVSHKHQVKVKVTQSCPTLCDPMNYTVHGIFQDRILEWVAFPFSRGSSQPRSPSWQVDSLPAEPQGKPKRNDNYIASNFFPGGASGKESSCKCRRYKRRGFHPCVRKIPWRRKWHPTPVFLPGKFHGQRSLAG